MQIVAESKVQGPFGPHPSGAALAKDRSRLSRSLDPHGDGTRDMIYFIMADRGEWFVFGRWPSWGIAPRERDDEGA